MDSVRVGIYSQVDSLRFAPIHVARERGYFEDVGIETEYFYAHGPAMQKALASGTATKTELLAAGYNSNPYKLPSYLSNGGSGWRTLIPAETKMYLAIYQSVDSNVDFTSNYVATNTVDEVSAASTGMAASAAHRTTETLLAWIGKELLTKTAALTHVIP